MGGNGELAKIAVFGIACALACLGLVEGKKSSGPLSQGLKDLAAQTGEGRSTRELDAKGDGLGSFTSEGGARTRTAGGDTEVLVRALCTSDDTSDVERVETALKGIGFKVGRSVGRAISGYMSTSRLGEAEEIEGLQSLIQVSMITRAGSVTSEGVAALNAATARTNHNVDGTGQVVGTLSDSFGRTNTVPFSTDVNTGDIPSDFILVSEFTGNSATDEGRAMMQLTFDVCPGCDLSFHTAFNGPEDFALGILELANCPANSFSGCTRPTTNGFKPATVLVDDILYLDEPMFADGFIAQAVDIVKAAGVPYFSAAGNVGSQAIVTSFNPGTTFAEGQLGGATRANYFGGIAHNWGTAGSPDHFLSFDSPQGVSVVFQYAERYFSVHPSGPVSDFDMYIFQNVNGQPGQLLANSVRDNPKGDPVELIQTSATGSLLLHIVRWSASTTSANNVQMQLVFFNPTNNLEGVATLNGPTNYGHSAAQGAISVGAANHQQNSSPPVPEPFTARGGQVIYFDTNGNPIAQVRAKPDIVATDGTRTTFFPSTAAPNFFGTSAAAPHAAGVAALMMQAAPGISPDNIKRAMQETALDMSTPGFDFLTGPGYLNADLAVARAKVIAAAAPQPTPITPVAGQGGPAPVPTTPASQGTATTIQALIAAGNFNQAATESADLDESANSLDLRQQIAAGLAADAGDNAKVGTEAQATDNIAAMAALVAGAKVHAQQSSLSGSLRTLTSNYRNRASGAGLITLASLRSLLASFQTINPIRSTTSGLGRLTQGHLRHALQAAVNAAAEEANATLEDLVILLMNLARADKTQGIPLCADAAHTTPDDCVGDFLYAEVLTAAEITAFSSHGITLGASFATAAAGEIAADGEVDFGAIISDQNRFDLAVLGGSANAGQNVGGMVRLLAVKAGGTAPLTYSNLAATTRVTVPGASSPPTDAKCSSRAPGGLGATQGAGTGNGVCTVDSTGIFTLVQAPVSNTNVPPPLTAPVVPPVTPVTPVTPVVIVGGGGGGGGGSLPIPVSSPTQPPTQPVSSPSGGGGSGGAIAGAVGGGVVFIAILAGVGFCLYRMLGQGKGTQPHSGYGQSVYGGYGGYNAPPGTPMY